MTVEVACREYELEPPVLTARPPLPKKFVVVVVAAAAVCNFCRTQIAVGHRIQGGSPAPILFPYAVAPECPLSVP